MKWKSIHRLISCGKNVLIWFYIYLHGIIYFKIWRPPFLGIYTISILFYLLPNIPFIFGISIWLKTIPWFQNEWYARFLVWIKSLENQNEYLYTYQFKICTERLRSIFLFVTCITIVLLMDITDMSNCTGFHTRR